MKRYWTCMLLACLSTVGLSAFTLAEEREIATWPESFAEVIEALYQGQINLFEVIDKFDYSRTDYGNSDEDLLKMFLEHGYSIDVVNQYGRSAFYEAAARGSYLILDLFVKYGADVNLSAWNGRTPLHNVAARSDLALTKKILDFGANPLVYDYDGKLPIDYAKDEDVRACLQEAMDSGSHSPSYADSMKKAYDFHGAEDPDFGLLKAVKNGDHEGALYYIRKGGDVNQVFEAWQGQEIPLIALWSIDCDMLQLLIDHGAELDPTISLKQYDGEVEVRTPLSWSIMTGSFENALTLIRAGANIHQTVDGDDLLLHFFRQHYRSDSAQKLAEELLDRGISIPSIDLEQHYENHLKLAIQFFSAQVVSKVLDALPDPYVVDPLTGRQIAGTYAEAFGSLEVLKLLQEREFQIDWNHVLLQNLGEPEARAKFYYAIEQGADVLFQDEDSNLNLLHASGISDPELVKEIVALGVDLEAKYSYGEETPLMIYSKGVSRRNKKVFKTLLEAGADLETTNDRGRTPFLLAMKEGRYRDAKMLLEYGANPLALDDDGMGAMHFFESTSWRRIGGFSSSKELQDFFDELVSLGLNVNARSSSGMTPLHVVSYYNRAIESIEFLVKNGADINAKDNEGNTALHLAESAEKFEELLLLGADPGALNHTGETPAVASLRLHNEVRPDSQSSYHLESWENHMRRFKEIFEKYDLLPRS